MSSRNLRVIIDEEGAMTFVYDDALAGLLELGDAQIERASHVEPSAGDSVRGISAGWVADMAPSGGPVLGPFRLRQEALDAERAWLRENRNL